MIFVQISFTINQNLNFVLGNPMPMQQMGQMQMQFNPNMPHNGMKGWSNIIKNQKISSQNQNLLKKRKCFIRFRFLNLKIIFILN